MKDNKGVTLIALVITIIVLLILAGITIAMLTGENGLITKSQKAASDTLVAEAKEGATAAVAAAYADYLDAKYTSNTGAVGTTAFPAENLSLSGTGYSVSGANVTITPKTSEGKTVSGVIQSSTTNAGGSIVWSVSE